MVVSTCCPYYTVLSSRGIAEGKMKQYVAMMIFVLAMTPLNTVYFIQYQYNEKSCLDKNINLVMPHL